MNNKELIASELAKVIDSLTKMLFKLAWTTKSSILVIAFPASHLQKWNARLLKQCCRIAEKIDQSAFEKSLQLDLTWTSS